MARLFREPHEISVTAPDVTVDLTGTSKRNYDAPPAVERTVMGMFQQRSGRQLQIGEGLIITVDAVLYSSDLSLTESELIEPNLGELGGEKYLIAFVEKKYGVDGTFSHLECLLTRDSARG